MFVDLQGQDGSYAGVARIRDYCNECEGEPAPIATRGATLHSAVSGANETGAPNLQVPGSGWLRPPIVSLSSPSVSPRRLSCSCTYGGIVKVRPPALLLAVQMPLALAVAVFGGCVLATGDSYQ